MNLPVIDTPFNKTERIDEKMDTGMQDAVYDPESKPITQSIHTKVVGNVTKDKI